jgi:hypothetical protein
MALSVRVAFPHGRVTEWYPQASGVQRSDSGDGWIEWRDVQLEKSGEPPATLEPASHYYAARNTDSWSLRSQGEREKLLFYRGIASIGVDLKPVLNSGGVSLLNAGSDPIPAAVVFENHAGKIGFRLIRGLREPVEVKFSGLTGSRDGVLAELEDELVEMGLYRKEARAMIATWRDSWFEEGLRVLYLLPRTKIDALLPISINPAPAQMARVFVGRVELLAPWMRAEIASALTSGDTAVLKKYGRFLDPFLDPFLDQMGNRDTQLMSARARQLLFESDRQILAESLHPPCGR